MTSWIPASDAWEDVGNAKAAVSALREFLRESSTDSTSIKSTSC
jgi:hypothetical protein